jgi:hypothetical protein
MTHQQAWRGPGGHHGGRANVAYPTDSGLLAPRGVTKLAGMVKALQGIGLATRTSGRGRTDPWLSDGQVGQPTFPPQRSWLKNCGSRLKVDGQPVDRGNTARI